MSYGNPVWCFVSFLLRQFVLYLSCSRSLPFSMPDGFIVWKPNQRIRETEQMGTRRPTGLKAIPLISPFPLKSLSGYHNTIVIPALNTRRILAELRISFRILRHAHVRSRSRVEKYVHTYIHGTTVPVVLRSPQCTYAHVVYPPLARSLTSPFFIVALKAVSFCLRSGGRGIEGGICSDSTTGSGLDVGLRSGNMRI